ncbi:hypothetical protein D3C84_977410 [compost metagenome]
MDGLGDQFLAHAGFAGDQHGQVAAAHQRDLFHQALVGLALADHVARLLAAGLAIDLGAAVLVLGLQGQAFDTLGGVDRGGGEAGEGLQGTQVDGLEALRIQ